MQSADTQPCTQSCTQPAHAHWHNRVHAHATHACATRRGSSLRPGGPVPAAASDAVQLSALWMSKIVQRLVELYGHAPWQVGGPRPARGRA
jgi:hypothetical protein